MLFYKLQDVVLYGIVFNRYKINACSHYTQMSKSWYAFWEDYCNIGDIDLIRVKELTFSTYVVQYREKGSKILPLYIS